MNLQPIVYVLVFVATFVAVEGLLLIVSNRRRANSGTTVRRLRALAKRLQAPEEGEGATVLRSELQRRSLAARLYSLLPGRQKLELRLYRAGSLSSPGRFVAMSLAVCAGGFVVGEALFSESGFGGLLGAIGLVPYYLLGRKAEKRVRRFEEQFPEALELLTRALRAGNSLTFAFQLIGEEMPDPIAREFAHLAEEVKLGQDLRVALANMAYRTGAGDLPYFCTAVLVQRETGGNLAELLDSLGYVIRDRFKLFGKVRSLTAVGKATANILGCWPVITIGGLLMVGADFVEILWTTRSGHILAAIALALVTLGYVLCRRAAEIRV